MKTVNIHEAKTHLSRLVEAVVKGEPFILAKAGKPLVRVEALTEAPPRRAGFLKGAVEIPEDFDDMGADQIQTLFEARPFFSTRTSFSGRRCAMK